MIAILNQMLLAVLNSLWIVAAVAALVSVVLKFTPRLNAATRYAIWWSVLGVVLVSPFLSPLTRHSTVTPMATPIESTVIGEPVTIEPATPLQATPINTAPASPTAWFPLQMPEGRWILWLFAAWWLGFSVQMLRVAASFRFLRAIKRRARPATSAQRLNFDTWIITCRIHRPVRLLVSNEIMSPIAVGFRNPAVILPESLLDEVSDAELDHVLLHELAHIARYDDWTNLVAHVATGALILHPIALWVLRRIEREREIACDDWGVAVTGSARPYAASLAKLVELCVVRRHEMLATGIAGRVSQLRERIERLMHRAGAGDGSPQASVGRVVSVAAVVIALAAAGACVPNWIAFAETQTPDPMFVALLEAMPAPALRAGVPPIAVLAPTPKPIPAPQAQTKPSPIPSAATAAQPAPTAPAPAPVPVPEPHALAQPLASVPFVPQPQSQPKGFLAALAASGYTNLSVDEVIELKTHGVTASFLAAMPKTGYAELTAKELRDLAMHGVTAGFIAEMSIAGYTKLTTKQLMDLAMYGATPAYIRMLHENGLTNLSIEEILQMRMYGVDARCVREAKQYGLTLTPRQLIRLKQAGVI